MSLCRADSDRCLKFRLMQLRIWIGNFQHSTNMRENVAQVTVDPLYIPKVSIIAWQSVIWAGTTQLEYYLGNQRMSTLDFLPLMSSRCHRILTQRTKINPGSSSILKWPEDCPSYQETLQWWWLQVKSRGERCQLWMMSQLQGLCFLKPQDKTSEIIP